MSPDYMRMKILLKNENVWGRLVKTYLLRPIQIENIQWPTILCCSKYWNLLPKSLRKTTSLDNFKPKLTTSLFIEAYGAWFALYMYSFCFIVVLLPLACPWIVIAMYLLIDWWAFYCDAGVCTGNLMILYIGMCIYLVYIFVCNNTGDQFGAL